MTTIITVHGTNAGDESDSGEQWWQQGSEFQNKLSEYVEAPDGRLEFKPFHWGVGPNSELKRRDAGNDLRRTMLDLEKENEPYSVIGHSHGGSVLKHALFSIYAKKISLPNMKSWVTVGTPFIQTERQGTYFNRFNFIGKVGILIAVISTLAGLLLALALGLDEQEGMASLINVDARQVFSGLFIGAFIILVSRFYTLRSNKRHSPQHQGKFIALFSPRWAAFNHPKDEAINGLQNAKHLQPRLLSREAVSRSLAPSAVVLAAVLWAIHEFVFTLMRFNMMFADTCERTNFLCKPAATVQLWANENMSVAGALMKAREGGDFGEVGFLQSYIDAYFQLRYSVSNFLIDTIEADYTRILSYETRSWIEALTAGPGLIIIFSIMIWIVFRLLGLIVSSPAANAINRNIANLARSTAYGADSYGEAVRGITESASDQHKQEHHFPAALADEIETYTDTYALDAIRKIRDLVSSDIGSANHSLSEKLGEALTWKELIHTAYFDVDNFIKLVAVSMCEAGLVSPSEKLVSDPAYDTVVAWYHQMQ